MISVLSKKNFGVTIASHSTKDSEVTEGNYYIDEIYFLKGS
jgi:hypothetical protein